MPLELKSPPAADFSVFQRNMTVTRGMTVTLQMSVSSHFRQFVRVEDIVQ